MIAAAKQKVDSITKRWIRNTADEMAVRAGHWFDEARGQEVVDWIQDYCCLYEGERAGQRMELADWQYEVTMRLFGWVWNSPDWGRPIRRFRKGSVWIPKKNGKSPTLAGWGLYIFCGDGEPGQKVYSVAKDGGQAMISFRHAIEMVKASEELREACEIKLGGREGPRIIHPASRSVYRIVAGDNPNSQEGLNGSVMVDETHVVDRRLMRILKGAGISRSEPLQIEVSTAGNNPDGYGKSQFDYGEKVNKGEVDDLHFFYHAYAAPQTISDDDLDKNIEVIGNAANPTMGRIVRLSEFMSEYQKAKATPSDLLDFKMYRLNIWQSSSNPFLPAGAWAACKEDFTEAEMEGKECYAGLDLSLKWDTTAFSLLFPWGFEGENPIYRLLVWFWLPEKTARIQRELVSWHNWAHAGHIKITDGDITDFPLVRRFIVDCSKRFNILEMAYDERFAQTFCQDLQDDHGMTVIPFGQGPKDMAAPMETFGATVIAKRLRHNGNPVMNWQAGNLAFKETNGAKRPVKPEGGAHLKIDGCVSTIMALGRAMLDEGYSVYEREGRGFVAL